MEKKSIPTCRTCPYMHMPYRAYCNRNNNGKPRGLCYCKHPDAEAVFMQVCPRSASMPRFIGYTPMGGDRPQIKTSPRWCPRRKEE